MTDHHTHLWTVPDEHGTWTCVACAEVSPTCVVEKPSDDEHGHPTGVPAQAICNSCLRHEQAVLDDTASALGHWQHQPRSLVPAIRYDRDKTTGGRTTNDRPTIQAPTDILDILWSWADMWADLRGDTANGNVLTWLKRHLLWAANTSHATAFDDYRTEIRQMRHAARKVAGLLPQRQAAPCIHCGGQIVQDWADENWQPRVGHRPEDRGLSDQVRCTGCDLTWPNRERWMYANGHSLQLLPTVNPDMLVTTEDARKHIWPHVTASTWRTWADRGELTATGRDVRGRALYRVGDLDVLVQRRADTTRAGRRTG